MIVITGGAGFIGSNLAAALEERGEHDLVVCDRLGQGEKWRNIAKRELAAIIPPDALLDFLEAHARDIQAVFHLGAVSSTTERDADLIIASNFSLSLALWEWCVRTETRFIYASSAATYGDGTAGFDDDGRTEALARLRPLNAYGWSKHLFDRRIARLVERGAPRPPQWAGLKFFNVFGPNEYHKGEMMSLIAKRFDDAKAGRPVRLFKSHRPGIADGDQRRDFLHVDDAVAVVRWLLATPSVSGLFNVGTGRARSFRDLISAMFAALGQQPNIEYIAMPDSIRDSYQYFTESSVDNLRRAGYNAGFLSLEEGVKRYVGGFLGRHDRFR
jgi:ADP-L-glycero-D-manno-heptose 6-epimerase